MFFVAIICASVDNKIHRFHKGVIFLDVERPDKITLPTEINYERNTKIVVRKISFLVEKEIDVTTGVIFVF